MPKASRDIVAERPGRGFYEQADALRTARELLGMTLVVPDPESGRRVAGRIVETEAYLGAPDKAAHAYGNRRTGRTEVLFGPGGHAYVFLIYGIYHQLNIVAGPAGVPYCVLVRGIEPLEGIDLMRLRRGPMKDENLTSGPGKLCIAFGIDKELYGADLVGGDRIFLEKGAAPPPEAIASGPRIGIDYAEEYAAKPWRFRIRGNPFVSRK